MKNLKVFVIENISISVDKSEILDLFSCFKKKSLMQLLASMYAANACYTLLHFSNLFYICEAPDDGYDTQFGDKS